MQAAQSADRERTQGTALAVLLWQVFGAANSGARFDQTAGTWIREILQQLSFASLHNGSTLPPTIWAKFESKPGGL